MPKSVEQIRMQIEKLQRQERALVEKEVEGVVARIREAVAHYQLTPEQIFGSLRNGAARRVPSSGAKSARGVESASLPSARVKAASVPKGTKLAVKYRDDAGNSWSGRGSHPRWLRHAIESGRKLEDFLI